MRLSISHLVTINALARQGLVSVEAGTSGEATWTSFVLPLLTLAPLQLSVAARVSRAYCWFVSGIKKNFFSLPHPLLDADGAVGARRHIGTTCLLVSGFILRMIIALSGAALVQVLDDAGGADGWRPLGTIVRVIPLLVPAVFPLETFATFTVDSTTAPLVVSNSDLLTAARALFFVRYADVPALPIGATPNPHVLSLAPVHALTVLREEEEEGEQQPAPP